MICDKTQKLNLWQNSKTKFVTKLKNSNCGKTWIMTNLKSCQKNALKGFLVTTFWHLDNQWDILWTANCNSCDVLAALSSSRSLIVCRLVNRSVGWSPLWRSNLWSIKWWLKTTYLSTYATVVTVVTVVKVVTIAQKKFYIFFIV